MGTKDDNEDAEAFRTSIGWTPGAGYAAIAAAKRVLDVQPQGVCKHGFLTCVHGECAIRCAECERDMWWNNTELAVALDRLADDGGIRLDSDEYEVL